jgi:quinol monooxygenase YgiN
VTSPGCLRFDVFQDESDPNRSLLRGLSGRRCLEAHRAAPHYSAWGNLPADWFVGQKAVEIRGTMIAPSDVEYR